MAKSTKKDDNTAKNQEPDNVGNGQNSNPENQNEAPEVQTNTGTATGENTGGEKGQDAALDNGSEETTTGTERSETGGEGHPLNPPQGDLKKGTKKGTKETDGKQEKRLKIAKGVFDKQTNVQRLFFTSDMVPFFKESDAIRHTAELTDKAVVTVNKE